MNTSLLKLFVPAFCASALLFVSVESLFAQSGRMGGYSESVSRQKGKPTDTADVPKANDDTIRVETDLVTLPVRVTSKDSKPLTDLKQSEFRVYENGIEQKLAYFSSVDQPFTVALLLDMSYSTVFKLNEIQSAAMLFVSQLKPNDKVTVIAFDEKPRILCTPTNDRRVLRLAIEGAKVGSGTALYDSLDLAVNKPLANVPGRKAIVLLTDGVDTSSGKATTRDLKDLFSEEDVIVYSLRYDTYDDVQANRRKDAEIRYDDDDRPYVFERPRVRGERETDYIQAREFLDMMSDTTGGHVFKVNSTTNLNAAFTRIADELRKTYSLGYYPTEERRPGVTYTLKVRIYRPNLTIRTRDVFTARPN